MVARFAFPTIVAVTALACALGATQLAGAREILASPMLLAQTSPTGPGTADAKPSPAANTPKRLPTAAPAKNDQTTDQNKRYRILTDRSEEKPRPLEGAIDPNSPGGAQNRQ